MAYKHHQPGKEQYGYKPTQGDAKKVKYMAGKGRSQKHIANHLGISIPTMKRYFSGELEEGRKELELHCASNVMVLADNLEDGSVALAANKFVLTTKCGWKETTRNEMTGAEGSPVTVVIRSSLNEDDNA